MNASTRCESGHLPHSLHPKLFRLISHYGAGLGKNALPLQKHFDPEDLHWLFGCFYVVEVLQDGADYRFGYCGPCWQLYYGLDPTGKKLSEVEFAESFKERRTDFDAVLTARQPSYCMGTMDWPDGRVVHFDRLTIPFGDAVGNVTMLLVAAQSDQNPAKLYLYKILGYPRVVTGEAFWPDPRQSAIHNFSTEVRAE